MQTAAIGQRCIGGNMTMKTMIRLLAAAAACLISTGAEAAVTYSIRQGANLAVSFETAAPITTAYTFSDFGSQKCTVNTFMGASACKALTLDPTYVNPVSGAMVQVALKSVNGSTTYDYFAADFLTRNGSAAGNSNRFALEVSGIPPVDPAAAVPEPATWALMLAGFGLTGAALRRRRVGFAQVSA